MSDKNHKKFKFDDPAYYLTLFTLEGHQTWRASLKMSKDGFAKEWDSTQSFNGGKKPKITEKHTIRIDRLTGQIIPLPDEK